MNVTSPCLTPQRIVQLRGDELPPEELAQIDEHLGQCPHCQELLDDSAANQVEWRDLRESLLNERKGEDHAWSGDAEMEPGESSSLEQILELLGPTDDPRMLGRIGTYEIVGVLGRGGMGVVFKGFDAALNRYVAIKLLLPHMATTGAARKRFAREAQAAAAIVDEHVMAIHGVAEWQGIPYLVMPYTRGISLQKRLADQGPLELREILRIGTQAAKALAAAHAQGLVHRDVKPANILLADGVERVTLMDFGLARAIDDASLTRTGVLAGTPQYMSPEQARGQMVDARSDLFSLGSVLYATGTGRAPFRAESSYGVLRLITDEEPRPIRELNPDLPEWLCAIVRRLMAKQPAERYASAAEVAGLLEGCLAHVQQPATVPLPAKAELPTHNPLRSHYSRGVFAMIVLFVSGLLGMFLWQATNPPDIAGVWSSTEWGDVELTPTAPGEYRGSYSQTHNDKPGEVRLKWSRVERRFNGAWSEGADCHGEASLRLAEGEIRGSFTTDVSSTIEPGIKPKLGDILLVRIDRKELTHGVSVAAILRQLEGDWEVLQDQESVGQPLYEGMFSFRDGTFLHRKQGKIVITGPLEISRKGSDTTFLMQYSDVGHIRGTLEFQKDGTLWLKTPDTTVRPRPEGPQPDALVKLRRIMIAEARKDDDPPSVITHNLRIRRADGSQAIFNDVVEASVGFPHGKLPTWEESPNRDGVVSLEKLPVGPHWLLAAGNSEERTPFKVTTPMRVTLPTGRFGKEPVPDDPAAALKKLAGIPVDRLLRKFRGWTKMNVEIKPSVVIDERDREFGEIIVVEIRNNTKGPLVVSEEDMQLRTEVGGERHESVLILSPGWVSEDQTPFPPITIEPGRSGELRFAWQAWLKSGLWARRTGPISEPGLPPAESGRMWVRVGIGNTGFSLVSVAAPKPPRLEFLTGYPELEGLSLETTEQQLRDLVAKHGLKLAHQPAEPTPPNAVTSKYWIEMKDGHTVIVMFIKGKCSGIQRIRGGIEMPVKELEGAEYQRFEGTWRIVTRTIDNAVEIGEFGKDGKHVIKDRQMGDAAISLDPAKTPREIDLTFTKGPDKGKVLRGIYEWVDDPKSNRPDALLRVCVSTKLTNAGEAADHRPKDFKARGSVDFAIWERTIVGHPQEGVSRDPYTSTAKINVNSLEPDRTGAAWPLFRGDAQACGVANTILPDKPTLLWKFAVEKGSFEGTAAVAEGRVFIGDLDGMLYCLDLATGEKKWEFKNEAGFKASPAVRHGLVYIGDLDGKFHCLHTDSGKPKWTYDTGGPIDSSASFFDWLVLVGSQDGQLYGLKSRSGTLAWKYQTQDQIRCSPTVAGDRAFVAGCDSKLHVIDLVKGTAVAGMPIESPTGVTPAVMGNLAYFGTEAGKFFAIDWQKSKVAWTFDSVGGSQPIRSSPAVTENCVIYGGRNKIVQALHPATGAELWTFQAKNRVDSSPVIVGARVYFGSADGRLYALDIKSGKEVWNYEAGGELSGSPAVAENRLIIASESGVVFCFGDPLPKLDGSSAKGLKFDVLVEKAKFAVGEPVNIQCTIKNTTDSLKPIGWHPSSGLHFCCVAADKKAWEGGVLPLAIPQITKQITAKSKEGQPGQILYLPAGESIQILLTYKAERPEKFKGRVVYDPVATRNGFPFKKPGDGPPWVGELISSNEFEYEFVAVEGPKESRP